MSVIPKNFDEWKACIEQRCGIPLTVSFARSRLVVYENQELPETRKFISLYGKEHYQNIVLWFHQIVDQTKNP